ncbi:MAG: Flp pilus assembly complex ATPase component TadA [Candidatus Omnitrophica bacterium]|nr:Flp pilus assembly complex ATPase component TadA [Candidatus Omnitrophota bacterium]
MWQKVDIIQLLLKQGIISAEQLAKANDEVKRTGLSLERALEKLGFIKEEDLTKTKANALGLPYINLENYIVDAELMKVIPEPVARKYNAVPLFKIGDTLTVGMINPQDIVARDTLRALAKIETIEAVLVSERGMHTVFDSYYGVVGSIDEIVKLIDNEKNLGAGETAEAPIIKLVNMMVLQAVKERASDIHVEPEEASVRIRYRVDGLLHEISLLPKKLQNSVISRIKILSNMDIAESRKPQDGRIRLVMEGKDLDIRVSTFPVVHGENVVMRLLNKSSVVLGLEQVGFLERDGAAFAKIIRRPNGIVLIAGPTGSGKTTTLYAALTTISTMEKNIITIEDPVEYELPLIRQTQVNVKAGLTFANGLRSILRQDPDIIMVGEIRDKETAEIAIQAALTGHLVFSTLHTNDAPSAVTRLIDMGVEPFLISSSLVGILAQRLVRVVCPKCKEKRVVADDALRSLGIARDTELYYGKGCSFCKNTGFLGRTGIFELCIITEEVKKLIDRKASADEIKGKAMEQGMQTLCVDGAVKITRGITTPEEVLQVVETSG